MRSWCHWSIPFRQWNSRCKWHQEHHRCCNGCIRTLMGRTWTICTLHLTCKRTSKRLHCQPGQLPWYFPSTGFWANTWALDTWFLLWSSSEVSQSHCRFWPTIRGVLNKWNFPRFGFSSRRKQNIQENQPKLPNLFLWAWLKKVLTSEVVKKLSKFKQAK